MMKKLMMCTYSIVGTMPTRGVSSGTSNYLVNEIQVGLVSKMADSGHL